MTKLFEVILYDLSEDDENDVDCFITTSGLELVSFCCDNFSDPSGNHDTIYEYEFASEADALHFVLRFGGLLR